MASDVIDRELAVDDLVVYYNNVYVIKKILSSMFIKGAAISIILLDKSPSTRAKIVRSKEVCLIRKEDAMIWMLKREQNV